MIELVPTMYYTDVFYWVMFSFCILTGFSYISSPGCEKLLRQKSIFLPLVLTIILIFYIGLRPVSWVFSDMMLYRHRWNIIEWQSLESIFDIKKEWFFDFILLNCKYYVHDVQFWFLVVEIFYIGCQFIACKKLLWENVWFAIAFVFYSFQFFTFGTNGIRNGMGCALMMLSIAFFCDRNTRGYIIGTFLIILGMGCHRSVIVPAAALFISFFIIKDLRIAIYIWCLCIIASLFAGNFFINLFSGFGVDERMSSYSTMTEDLAAIFSHVGFRWDFLLYSAMPVWLAWHVATKQIEDKTFNLLANTYIISNSFWVLVCRVAFSNRFAYLSWFLYGLVIAYAVIRVPIWDDQDSKAGKILLAHAGFTFFMFLIGK